MTLSNFTAGAMDSRSQRTLRQADHLRRNADAALVERLNRDLVALANLTENVCLIHL